MLGGWGSGGIGDGLGVGVGGFGSGAGGSGPVGIPGPGVGWGGSHFVVERAAAMVRAAPFVARVWRPRFRRYPPPPRLNSGQRGRLALADGERVTEPFGGVAGGLVCVG